MKNLFTVMGCREDRQQVGIVMQKKGFAANRPSLVTWFFLCSKNLFDWLDRIFDGLHTIVRRFWSVLSIFHASRIFPISFRFVCAFFFSHSRPNFFPDWLWHLVYLCPHFSFSTSEIRVSNLTLWNTNTNSILISMGFFSRKQNKSKQKQKNTWIKNIAKITYMYCAIVLTNEDVVHFVSWICDAQRQQKKGKRTKTKR